MFNSGMVSRFHAVLDPEKKSKTILEKAFPFTLSLFLFLDFCDQWPNTLQTIFTEKLQNLGLSGPLPGLCPSFVLGNLEIRIQNLVLSVYSQMVSFTFVRFLPQNHRWAVN
jgi:hypothetical protein